MAHFVYDKAAEKILFEADDGEHLSVEVVKAWAALEQAAYLESIGEQLDYCQQYLWKIQEQMNP